MFMQRFRAAVFVAPDAGYHVLRQHVRDQSPQPAMDATGKVKGTTTSRSQNQYEVHEQQLVQVRCRASRS
jgi:hypothetical protein